MSKGSRARRETVRTIHRIFEPFDFKLYAPGWISRDRVEELVAELEREVDHMIGMGVGREGVEHAVGTAALRLSEALHAEVGRRLTPPADESPAED